jgi:hypothetical protein
MGGLDLAVSQIVILLLLQGNDLGFGQDDAFFGYLLLKGCQPLLETGQVVT